MNRMALVVLVLILGTNHCLAKTPTSLCTKSELEVFNCKFKAKSLSLCGTADNKTLSSTIQYRFGLHNKVELAYPKIAKEPSGSFWFSSTGYSGGGEQRVHFRNHQYDYILFDRTIRTGFGNGPNNPEFSSGLIIKKLGKITSIQKCSNNTQLNIPNGMMIPEEEFDRSIDFE